MKKLVIILTLALFLGSIGVGQVWAYDDVSSEAQSWEAYDNAPKEKFKEGAGQFFGAPLHFMEDVSEQTREYDNKLIGASVGIAKGVTEGAGEMVSGLVKMFSFPVRDL